jgi:ABC-type transport system substrate-binding protein
VVMHAADGPYADPRVREAFRLAVDREAMVKQVLVLQPHLVMFEVLSLVVACPGVGLVVSSPVGPVVGVCSGM